MNRTIILSVFNSILRRCGAKPSYVTINRTVAVCASVSKKRFKMPDSLYSTASQQTVSFDEFKKLATTNRAYIIDVREPQELTETGVIPNSVNIPLGEVESALKDLSEDQFKKKYGREKPTKDLEVIFTCKMGIRSGKAQNLSQQLGYKNVKNYLGGWTEWEEQLKK